MSPGWQPMMVVSGTRASEPGYQSRQAVVTHIRSRGSPDVDRDIDGGRTAIISRFSIPLTPGSFFHIILDHSALRLNSSFSPVSQNRADDLPSLGSRGLTEAFWMARSTGMALVWQVVSMLSGRLGGVNVAIR
jgi:hypothetical protein